MRVRQAIVTGGASGIGAATVKRLIEDGYAVAIFDLNDELGQQMVSLNDAISYVHVDVTDELATRRAMEEIAQVNGRPADLLINSAGMVVPVITSRAVDPALHRTIWDVNYFGTFNTSRNFADLLIKADQGGAIVNLASTSSLRPVPAAHYTPGKYAVKGLTELMAAELGPRGIRVNAVAPTFTMTPPMLARIESGHRSIEALKSQSALKMLVTPEHIANGIAFLASSQAEAITGVTLPIDAGWLVSIPYESMDAPIQDVVEIKQ